MVVRCVCMCFNFSLILVTTGQLKYSNYPTPQSKINLIQFHGIEICQADYVNSLNS